MAKTSLFTKPETKSRGLDFSFYWTNLQYHGTIASMQQEEKVVTVLQPNKNINFQKNLLARV